MQMLILSTLNSILRKCISLLPFPKCIFLPPPPTPRQKEQHISRTTSSSSQTQSAAMALHTSTARARASPHNISSTIQTFSFFIIIKTITNNKFKH